MSEKTNENNLKGYIWNINVFIIRVWQVLVDYRVVYCANRLNIELQNGIFQKDKIDGSTF